jgi:hypothetical protein
MNSDDLLAQFRSSVPLPDDPVSDRIYARATSSRPRIARPRLAVLIAATAVAAVGVAALDGTFEGGATQANEGGPKIALKVAPPDILSVTPDLSDDGTLASLSVTTKPTIADANTEVEVLLFDNTRTGTNHVVFEEQVPTTASSWSGTLYPNDWSGGCQSGRYAVLVVSVAPGASLDDATPENSEWDYSKGFNCR